MQENLPRSSVSQNVVIYINEHIIQSFRSEQPEDNSAPKSHNEQLDAQIAQIRLSQSSSRSVSEEDAQEVGDSDDGDMNRPLLIS